MKDYTLSKEKIAELGKFHRSLRDKRQADRIKAVIVLSKGWSAAQWNTYKAGVWAKAKGTLRLDPGAPWGFDTGYEDNHDWYYIGPLGKMAKGHEINYMGVGMLFARWGWSNKTTVGFPRGWKIPNKIGDMVNPWWNPGYTWQPTSNELFFSNYGYNQYNLK